MSGFLSRLFGGGGEEVPKRDVSALAEPLAVPAVHVLASEAPSTSRLGGTVRLPPGVEWPTCDGVKLTLLASIALVELQRAVAIPWLPREGTLLFFYDRVNQPWGFNPKDRGAWAVLHVPDGEVARIVSADVALPAKNVMLRAIRSWPSTDRASVEQLRLTDEESDRYIELRENVFEREPKHQIGGYPTPVQNDLMELEAQLASNGQHCGEPAGYETPRAKQLAPGAANWKLLLQFDTDEELDVMWGDDGTLYFWVEESRARAGDFTNVWLVLQCG